MRVRDVGIVVGGCGCVLQLRWIAGSSCICGLSVVVPVGCGLCLCALGVAGVAFPAFFRRSYVVTVYSQ